ncbi:MAG: hypothetical protein IPM84_14790 [Anaerolineae bacterium]|nr:hypothetical protein [Anaerolineae bacterium]
MQLLIDPEAFKVASTNEACTRTLAGLDQNKDRYRFVMTRLLKKAYGEFVSSPGSLKSNGEQVARAVARHLVSGTRFKALPIDSDIEDSLPRHIQEVIVECKLDDIDRHLIQVALRQCNNRIPSDIGSSIVLLLACSFQIYRTVLTTVVNS